ncbi:MAG: IS5 family transposase [Chloroflexi bacterium]|nr:IS5 family transposase [Chloroflexota bacterium]
MLRAKSNQFSFYGDHIYDRVIPETHFLKLLDKVADFSFVNDLCRDAYNPDLGRPAYEPAMMFKILFLQFLYDISDRRIEEEVNFNLILKWFVGLAIDESPPDATSLTRFRERLGEERFASIFNQIVSLAREKGLISNRLSIVDSTHVRAKVDTFKMQANPEHTPDKDARYGYKTKNKPFFGYKAHTGIDADSELITKVVTTPGNVHDGDVFRKVLDDKSQMVTADKAYDSKKNHRLLKRKKKKSAIIIKKNRKSKRLKKHQIKAEVAAAQRERPKIERKIAELKRYHGLTVARYWGLAKMAIQNLMAAITCNLKRMVKLMFLQREGKPFTPIETPLGITVPI